MKFIIICGFYATGSSAVVDFMKEFDNVYVIPEEFRLVSDPYGIRALEENLVEHWSPLRASAAINDFLKYVKSCSKKKSFFPLAGFGMGYADDIHPDFVQISQRYIESMCVSTYFQDYYFNKAKKGYLTYVIDRCRLGVHVYSKNKVPIAHKYLCYLSRPSKEQFYESTKRYLDELFGKFSDKEYIVLDQGIHPWDADVIDKYFSDAKMIAIDRDWRDVYISSVEHHGVMESDVSSYITKQKMICELHCSSRNFMQMSFEELVTEYDQSICKIMDFLELDSKNHVHPKKYFDPSRSIKNVGIWKQYYKKYPQIMDAITSYYESLR